VAFGGAPSSSETSLYHCSKESPNFSFRDSTNPMGLAPGFQVLFGIMLPSYPVSADTHKLAERAFELCRQISGIRIHGISSGGRDGGAHRFEIWGRKGIHICDR